jgi:adenosylcobinamide-phosphate synthase
MAVCGGVAFALVEGAQRLHPTAGAVVSVLIIYSCLGARDLSDHAVRVRRRLAEQDLEGARQAVGMMVSRDTGELDAGNVSRGAIESVAENLVDGAIAPLLFAGLFGPVGAVVFKAVSTMDSMIGKRDERYRECGTFAARLDDVLNFIPARLGYLLIAVAAPLVRLNSGAALRIGWRDRKKHDSPNSAWSEAAFAGALGVKLGGVDSYGGEPKPHPLLGDGCGPSVTHLTSAIRLMWVSYVLAFALVAAFSFARP